MYNWVQNQIKKTKQQLRGQNYYIFDQLIITLSQNNVN